MSDNEVEENSTRGADWEVVTLTASTYAAAPGPNERKVSDHDEGVTYKEDAAETSRALFMSGHFVFPPSQNENLRPELDTGDILEDHLGKKVASGEAGFEGGNKSVGKGVEDWTLEGLKMADEFPDMIFDEKGNELPISSTGFGESMNLEKEKSLYGTDTLSSLHCETEFGKSTVFDESLHIPEVSEESNLDAPRDISCSPTPVEDDKHDGSNQQHEAWWKRSAASLYGHAKDANAFWSILISAAVVGLVILGQRWQQERRQAPQLKWQATNNIERSGRMMVPIYQLKDAIIGGHRQGSFVSGSSSFSN